MKFTGELQPHQEDAIQWMIDKENHKGGVLADDVGLGKTVTSIALICANHVPKTLVLVPKSLLTQWNDHLKQFSNIKKTDETVTIVSISSLNSRSLKSPTDSIYHKTHWDRIIVDEAHCIRNRSSKIHKAICGLNGTIKWALTATPIMNKMSDFISLMRFIGVSQLECQQEKEKVVQNYILRRTKQLETECYIKNYNLQLNKDKEIYDFLFEETKSKIKKLQTKNVIQALEWILRLRQFCISPKIFIDSMKKKDPSLDFPDFPLIGSKEIEFKKILNNQKTLIFCHFIQEMDIYSQIVKDSGYKSLHLCGKMSLEERDECIKTFKNEDDINYLFVQIQTGGQGYNFQFASRIIFISPDWNPCNEHQAIGRAYRSGQINDVEVVKLITENTIETRIVELQNQKKELIKTILADKAGDKNKRIDKIKQISFQDIEKLVNINGSTTSN